MMCHQTFVEYYRVMFGLMHHHKYSITEMENCFPFEFEIYMTLFRQWAEEMEEKRKQQEGGSSSLIG